MAVFLFHLIAMFTSPANSLVPQTVPPSLVLQIKKQETSGPPDSTQSLVEFDSEKTWAANHAAKVINVWPSSGAFLQRQQDQHHQESSVVVGSEGVFDFGDGVGFSLSQSSSQESSHHEKRHLNATSTNSKSHYQGMTVLDGGPIISKEKARESMKIAYQIAMAAGSAGVPYFFLYGSALSVFRDGSSPMNDDDVDIAVLTEDLPRIAMALQSNGIYYKPTVSHLGLSTQSAKSKVVIDVWAYRLSPDGKYVCFDCPSMSKCDNRDAYPANMILPTSAVPVKNMGNLSEVQLPRDPAGFLSEVYGKDWRVPKVGYKGSGLWSFRHDQYCQEKPNARLSTIQIDTRMSYIFVSTVVLCFSVSVLVVRLSLVPERAAFSLGLSSGGAMIFIMYSALWLALKFFINASGHLKYAPVLMMFYVAALKFAISIVLFRIQDGTFHELRGFIYQDWKTLTLYVVPAALYTATDAITVFCLKSVDPLTFSVMDMVRTGMVACAWQAVFKTGLSNGRIIGIVIIGVGAVMQQLTHVADMHWGNARVQTYMLMLVVAACGTTASLYNERQLKASSLPLNIQNMAMYAYALIFALMVHGVSGQSGGMSLMSEGSNMREQMLLATCVILYACFGIIAAHFLKHLGNILRIVCNAFILVASVPLQIVFLQYQFDLIEFLGVATLVVGMALYAEASPDGK